AGDPDRRAQPALAQLRQRRPAVAAPHPHPQSGVRAPEVRVTPPGGARVHHAAHLEACPGLAHPRAQDVRAQGAARRVHHDRAEQPMKALRRLPSWPLALLLATAPAAAVAAAQPQEPAAAVAALPAPKNVAISPLTPLPGTPPTYGVKLGRGQLAAP